MVYFCTTRDVWDVDMFFICVILLIGIGYAKIAALGTAHKSNKLIDISRGFITKTTTYLFIKHITSYAYVSYYAIS